MSQFKRWAITVCLAALLPITVQAAPRDDRPANPLAEPTQPRAFVLQVEGLQLLHDLDLTKAQLNALRDVASRVNTRPVEFHLKITRPFRMAMIELRKALVANNDDGKIADAQEKLEQAREADDIGPDPILELNADAKANAKEALAILTVSQVAQYISQHADDVPDPLTSLNDALDAMDDPATQPWDSLRTTTAQQVAILLHGLDSSETETTQKKIEDWLSKAHDLSKDGRKDQRTALQQEAAQIVQHPDPIDCLRHWLERDLAELLVNHQLKTCIDIALTTANE